MDFRISLVLLFLFQFNATKSESIQTKDLVNVSYIKTTFSLENEIYRFRLVPAFQVPLDVVRHRIFTASFSTVKRSFKRAIPDLSEEDVEKLIHGKKTRKRSVRSHCNIRKAPSLPNHKPKTGVMEQF